MNRHPTKFEWLAGDSAPLLYPMEIIQGDFFFAQGSSRYIPSGGTIRVGWGNYSSTHVGGDDKYPIPNRLKILFFSLTENQFYQGDFELPYQQMLELFQQSHKQDDKPFRRIVAGVAPGGAVAVWLSRGAKIKEVFFGQAEKVDYRYGRVLGLPFKDKQEEDAFVLKILADTVGPEEFAALQKNGVPFGIWARYRNLYRWNLTINPDVKLKRAEYGIAYLNGESQDVYYPFTEQIINTPRPLPLIIYIVPMINGVGRPYVIYLNDVEIMQAVEQLAAKGDMVTVAIDPGWPREQTQVQVTNGEQSITLKNIRVSDR